MSGPEAETAMACPICGALSARVVLSTLRLRVAACSACGHRVAEHARAIDLPDYHLQYEQGDFVEALRATRVRQAIRILERVRRVAPDSTSLLDYGCGRGWFLDVARAQGFERVAGADTSRVAVDLLDRRGIAGILLKDAPEPAGPALPFVPDVVSFLDVVEHLPPARVSATLRDVIGRFRPRLVVVKVPVSTGILHRTATALSAAGATAALEQLYQVGTDPPHFSYFSPRSLETAVEAAGLSVVSRLRDRDFEPATLARRAAVLAKAPRIATAAGWIAAFLARSFAMEDSLIVLARPDRAAA